MGGRRGALCLAALTALAGRADAATQAEPIARLTLEGGYDSNPLYDGRGDGVGVISPDVGLRLRDRLWSATATYGGDYLNYRHLASSAIWNQRGLFRLDATFTHRLTLRADARGSYAYDPLGLAYAGVFVANRQSALIFQAGGRADYAASERIGLAAALTERLVRFDDGSGGAMHAPSLEALWHRDERLSFGGAYAMKFFQDFHAGGGETDGFSHGMRARLRYLVTRFVEADAFAGPALWSGPQGVAVVPEIGGELLLSTREWDLRLSASHQLGIGATASAGLVNSVELGTVRRFGRRWDVHVNGGIWQSGDIPSGRNATLGWAVGGELGWHLTRELRLVASASHLARLDDPSPNLKRTTVGFGVGWELPAR
jgi:hypothetical protein